MAPGIEERGEESARLRRLRRELGLRQIDLAAHTGVSARTIKRWEAGQVRIPKVVFLYLDTKHWE